VQDASPCVAIESADRAFERGFCAGTNNNLPLNDMLFWTPSGVWRADGDRTHRPRSGVYCSRACRGYNVELSTGSRTPCWTRDHGSTSRRGRSDGFGASRWGSRRQSSAELFNARSIC